MTLAGIGAPEQQSDRIPGIQVAPVSFEKGSLTFTESLARCGPNDNPVKFWTGRSAEGSGRRAGGGLT